MGRKLASTSVGRQKSRMSSFFPRAPRAKSVLLKTSAKGVAEVSLHCAHPFGFSSLFQCLAKQGHEKLSTAAVERGPSEGARSGGKESSSRPCVTPSVTTTPLHPSNSSASYPSRFRSSPRFLRPPLHWRRDRPALG